MRLEFAVIATLATVANAGADTPEFINVDVPKHVYDGGWEHFVGGGVAVFDCNGDSLPELFAAGGSNQSQLFINTSKEQISFQAETPEDLSLAGVTGAYPLDVDSDGVMDLAILRVGPDLLLRGHRRLPIQPFR